MQKNRKSAPKKASAADKQATGGPTKKDNQLPASNDITTKIKVVLLQRKADTQTSPLPPTPLLRSEAPHGASLAENEAALVSPSPAHSPLPSGPRQWAQKMGVKRSDVNKSCYLLGAFNSNVLFRYLRPTQEAIPRVAKTTSTLL